MKQAVGNFSRGYRSFIGCAAFAHQGCIIRVRRLFLRILLLTATFHALSGACAASEDIVQIPANDVSLTGATIVDIGQYSLENYGMTFDAGPFRGSGLFIPDEGPLPISVNGMGTGASGDFVDAYVPIGAGSSASFSFGPAGVDAFAFSPGGPILTAIVDPSGAFLSYALTAVSSKGHTYTFTSLAIAGPEPREAPGIAVKAVEGSIVQVTITTFYSSPGTNQIQGGIASLRAVRSLPTVEFTRGIDCDYVVGSSFYVNARLGGSAVDADFYINGAKLQKKGQLGNTVSLEWTTPVAGVFKLSAFATDSWGFVSEPVSADIHSALPLSPLPSVEMLPIADGSDSPVAGGFQLLRAKAEFAGGSGSVEFHANGVYIGTGRSVGGSTYELAWLTPSLPSTFAITVQAITQVSTDPSSGRPMLASTISSNGATITTIKLDDVTLAAGRTTFKPVVKQLTWPEAHADAIASGGRLAVFPTGAMYDRVIAKIRQTYSDALWLGLTDREEEGVWRWIDGSPLVESRWNKGEPNNYNGDEDYAQVWWGGTAWNDNSGQVPAYLIEKSPLALASLPMTSGGVPWSVEGNDSADAKDSAKAMTSDGGSAWREYTFTGPAEVQFQWKVSSQAGDSFSYSVDGITIKSISGEVPWTNETVKLPPGAHTIRWTYQKDTAGSAGADAGFLDCLAFWQESGAQLGAQPDGDWVHFGVWAPNATAVSVVGDFNGWMEAPLERNADTGYWSGSVAGAFHGQEYQYLIRWPGNEAGRLKNDPRADWIRNGHSVIYDHAAFDWGEGFLPQAGSTGLVYELHIGTFNNPSPKTKPVATFDDAIQRLDYLQQLGVEIIALMPVTEYETASSWGYNPAYLFAVENDYGGPDGFKRFVKAAHARGMKVQLDIVHNHYNPNNSGLLQFDGPGADGTGNGIYFYSDKARGTTPWGPRPDFSQLEVRRYVTDNAGHWLEKYRIDGFRWDAPKYILGYAASGQSTEPDTLLPEAKSLMTEVNRMIHERFPGKWSIAEEPNLLVAGAPLNWGQIYLDAAVTDTAESFDGHWQYAFYDGIQKNLSKGEISVSSMLSRVMNYSQPPATRVIFTDTHDLAGELNKGLRWPHRVGEQDPDSKLARKKSLLGAVLALTAPGSPMLFMGQEFHATGTFSDRRPVDWSAAAVRHRIFRAYRDLAALRRDFASVRNTALSSSYGANDGLELGRYWRGNDVVVVLNASAQRIENELCTFPAGGEWFVRINTDTNDYGADFEGIGPEGGVVNVTAQNNRAPVSIGAYSAIVFTRTPPSPPTEDADNDGLPDTWETITGSSDPNMDDDGDGLTNLREFLSGLDPRIYNTDSVVGDFNDWDAVASPLVQALGNAQHLGHMQYFPEQSSGQFRWLLQGTYYGGESSANLTAGGAPIAYQAPAGSYLYFTQGDTSDTAAVDPIDPDHPIDTNNDGFDDAWQSHYGLRDPAGDADGDRISNIAEFHRGSNPLVIDRTPALVGNVLPLGWTPDEPQLRMTWSDKRRRWEWSGTLPAGALEFKFAMGPGWSGDNHGRSSENGRTDTTGGNIEANLPATSRYRFSFNESSKSYSIEEFPLKAEWREKHGLASDVGWKEDTDGDGISNLVEYALGGDPRRPDAAGLGPRAHAAAHGIATLSADNEWIYTWIENTDPDVSIWPEITGDLDLWETTFAEIAADQTSVPAGHLRKQVRIPLGTDRFFLRLQTSMP